MNSETMWKLSLASFAVCLTACITVEGPSIPSSVSKQDAGVAASDDDDAVVPDTATGTGKKDEPDTKTPPSSSCKKDGEITGIGTMCMSLNKPDLCADCGGFFYSCLDGSSLQPEGMDCYRPSNAFAGVCCVEHQCARYSATDNQCSNGRKSYHCDVDTQRPTGCVGVSSNPSMACCP